MKTPSLLASVLLGSTAVVALIPGCDKPAPPQNNSGGGLSGLSSQPTSTLGKSAAAGKNVAKQAEQAQAAASGMAEEVSGQTTALKVGGLEFRPPSSWEKIPPANSMQAALLRVAADTGAGETQCVFLPGIGGGTQANVDRWRGQVVNPDTNQPAESKVETRTIAGMKTTLVSMSGTYSGMSTGTTKPMPGFGFRGAIIEAPGGAIFVRLTGPKDNVDAAAKTWEQMVLGLRK